MRWQRAAGGFSLLELLIGVAVSLVLFAGALSVYLSSRDTYAADEQQAFLQRTGRSALQAIERDVRMAGVRVCSRLDDGRTRNGLATADTMAWDFTRPIIGYDAHDGTWDTGDGPPFDAEFAPEPQAYSDVLVLRVPARAGPTLRLRARPADPNAPLQILDPPAGFAPAAGDLMMITDCSSAAYFQVSGYDPATTTIEHRAGAAGGVPGNADDSLGWVFDAGPGTTAQLLPMNAVAWFVRSGADGGPALWRRVGRKPPEELIRGVESLQLLYGEDDDLDLAVDGYRNARDVRDWRNVIAVRVSLLVRLPGEDGTPPDVRIYEMLDAPAFDPPDERVLRDEFTTTVSLRNRAG